MREPHEKWFFIALWIVIIGGAILDTVRGPILDDPKPCICK